MTQSQAYYCLKSCVKDFTGPNIDMFCMIVEYCGRYLYLQPESHARLAHLVSLVYSTLFFIPVLVPRSK